MVRADAAIVAVFTRASLPLVLADTTAAIVFTPVPLSLVLADAAAATVCTPAPQSLSFALAKVQALAALHGHKESSISADTFPDGFDVLSPRILATLSAWAPAVFARFRHPLTSHAHVKYLS